MIDFNDKMRLSIIILIFIVINMLLFIKNRIKNIDIVFILLLLLIIVLNKSIFNINISSK